MPRRDPTRTTTLVRRFQADLRRRFRTIKEEINRLVVNLDVFGLVASSPFTFNVEAQAWRFQTDEDKLISFRKWLQPQIDQNLLSIDPISGKPWSSKYINSAYRQGTVRAFIDARGISDTEFASGSQAEFLRAAFNQPERLSKIRFLATRTFNEIQILSDTAKGQLNRQLALGLANGLNPRTIARNMSVTIDNLTRKHALVIARTEIIAAHAEGQLDSFEDLGIDEIGILAEWSTAGDDRVCPLCAPLDGEIMTVKEARGLIPRHPNCRCAWVPTTVANSRARKASLAKSFRKSIQAEKPKGSFKKAKRASTWLGKRR